MAIEGEQIKGPLKGRQENDHPGLRYQAVAIGRAPQGKPQLIICSMTASEGSDDVMEAVFLNMCQRCCVLGFLLKEDLNVLRPSKISRG